MRALSVPAAIGLLSHSHHLVLLAQVALGTTLHKEWEAVF